MNEVKSNWYILQVTSSQEKKVKNLITDTLNNHNYSHLCHQILLPTYTSRKYSSNEDKFLEKELVIMPGYLAIKMIFNSEVIKLISRLPGVIKFLGSKNQPILVKAKEINNLLSLDSENTKTILNVLGYIRVDSNVIIKSGPFINFRGTVKKITGDECLIEVYILGRSTIINLKTQDLELS